ncbi:hypothetical protein [Bradyrhizobium sp. USDA 4449]
MAARPVCREARLQTYGFDEHAVNTEVYVQVRKILALFEALLNGAQLRRIFLLKELATFVELDLIATLL